MHLKLLTPKQALNKAYLKEKIGRNDIELFKTHFADLLNKINEKGDEEHLKSLISDFLKFTWYKDAYQINPLGKNDLVIHTGKSPSDPIGVILEVKSPSNKPEMISAAKTNAKAIHELILYYLNERITNNKHDIKQLIATNIFEWFVFDANEFDKKIYRSTAIKKLYEQKKADNKDNPWFYDELKKLLENNELLLECTYFDIRDYKKQALNNKDEDDKKLIPLFKILSPVHLLKLSFANDSNTLQPKFYTELLHIIGLYEYKEGSKKLISRKKEGERNAGSLLENAIVNLDSHDKISRLEKPSQYGETYQERTFNVALELVITWVNRILFLKLLEAQLLNYHKGNKAYTFLNKDKIRDFDELDKLFFRVLAKKVNERDSEITKLFGKVPYLNSSLFEPTELEHQTLFINGLEDFISLPVIGSTVLKDNKGKTRKGSVETLDYLFDFLNAYDFSSEGAEEIQEENKTLINASVLGLIFEKINGYKDGSFFTPGFITMYMCRETIRRAVVQKFNEVKGWELKEYSELYDVIKDRKEANTIINSLKICDPAVGSGHFLVSALNEIIAIKHDLNILLSSDGRTLRDCNIEVVNDELIITDENNDPFKYNFHDHRSQVIQQTLFHEKQTIIENCLFGVDINPNSVKICRLRLWIELLKNAYYKTAVDGEQELETLPNIDINIKTGNSLISRFTLDTDLKQALKKNKLTIEDYKNAVTTYQNAHDKEQKREMEGIINTIKSNFRTEISRNAKEVKERNKLRSQLEVLLSTNQDLFGAKRSKKQLELEQRRLELALEKQEEIIEEIKNNKIYENAFEWRFEFPEVLSDAGDFLGFDVIIGNPPYIQHRGLAYISNYLKTEYDVYSGTADISVYFYELGLKVLRSKGVLSYIGTNKFFNAEYGVKLREFLLHNSLDLLINFEQVPIFDEALVSSAIFLFRKDFKDVNLTQHFTFFKEKINPDKFLNATNNSNNIIDLSTFKGKPWLFFEDDSNTLIAKIKQAGTQLSNLTNIFIRRGITTGLDKAFIVDEKQYLKFIEESPNESKILMPVLFGENIKRYSIEYKRNYLINAHNGLKDVLPRINLAKDYPVIYRWLDNQNSLLSKKVELRSDQGEHWTNLRSCAFIKEFVETKIIWGLISGTWSFALDNEGYFLTSASYFMISRNVDPRYLLGLLNSRLYKYYFTKIGEYTAGGAFVMKKTSIEKLIMPNNPSGYQREIISLVTKILENKKNNNGTKELEEEINKIVYAIYNLTKDEISIIEKES